MSTRIHRVPLAFMFVLLYFAAAPAHAQRLPGPPADGRQLPPARPQLPPGQTQPPQGQRQLPPVQTQRAANDQAPIRTELARPKPGPVMLRAPFVLTPDEQQRVDRLLDEWEKSGTAVKTFMCEFRRWEYDMVFGKKENDFLQTESLGTISFKRPDWGKFDVKSGQDFVAPTPPETKFKQVKNPDLRETWACDGLSIYQFDFKKKQLKETRLPPELRGAAIAEGPIPFMFGSKAEQLKQRYFVRMLKPPDEKTQVCLEAWPRTQADAANFSKVQCLLTKSDLMPYYVMVFLPGATETAPSPKKTVYQFKNVTVNSKLREWTGEFSKPTTPFGWTHVVEDVPSPPAPKDAQRPGAEPANARRPANNPRR